MSSAKKRTWAIIAEDGRHSLVGRHSDPAPEEITAIEAQLAEHKLAGWLVIMEGDYHRRGDMSFVVVQPMASPAGAFADARAAFEAIRQKMLAG
jgi:hypothetical protein